MTRVVTDFKSWSEYLDYARAMGDVRFERSEWTGTRSLSETLAIADRGWPEGMARVHPLSVPFVNTLVTTQAEVSRWSWDVTGSNYDVGEYLSGTPECWLTTHTHETRPVISITVELPVSGGLPTKAIELRGAAVMALTLALQASGYVVQLYGVLGTDAGGGKAWTRVPLLDANGGPIDVDRLVYALANPGGLRGLGYAVVSHVEIGQAKYGRLAWNNEPMPEEWGKSDLFLSRGHINEGRWTDEQYVSKWVTDSYANLTGGSNGQA